MPSSYDFYDYVGYWKNRQYENLCEKIVIQRFLNIIGKRDSIVDIGGGFGRLSHLYAPFFTRCVVVDPSQNLLNTGKERLKDFRNIGFKIGNFPKLPFKDNSFDAAICVRVIHHIKDSMLVAKESFRIVKPGGYLILEVANKIHFLARLKAHRRLDFSFSRDLQPIDRRSQESIDSKLITFVNHNPKKVFDDLEKSGLKIIKVVSVSNLRSEFLKKVIPVRLMMFIESIFQNCCFIRFFGPSVFILAQKQN